MAQPQGDLSGPGFTRVAPISPYKGAPDAAPLLYDANGNPWSVRRDPLAPRNDAFASSIVRDIPISLTELQWSVQEIRNALENHCNGLFMESAMLFDAVIGDDRVQAALGSRLGGLFGLPEIMEAGEDDDDGAVLAAWKDAFPKCVQNPLVGDSLVEIKRWAHGLGFGVGELQWDTSVTPWQPYLKPWHPQHFYFDWARRTLVAITLDGPVDVVPGDGRWFVHAPHGLWRGWMQGAVRALALPWLLRSLAFRDWARYSERHGMPLIKAMMPAHAKAEDKDRFVSSLSTMGTEAVVSLPQGLDGTGFDVALIEAASQSWEGFDRLIVRCDSAITLTLQWQNLTTEVKEGSFAAARVHGDVKQSAIEFDDTTLARDVGWQIGRPFAAWNFGKPQAAPRTHHDVEPLEDRDAEMKALESFGRTVQSLATGRVQFDPAELARRYRIRGMRDAKLLPPPTPGAGPTQKFTEASDAEPK